MTAPEIRQKQIESYGSYQIERAAIIFRVAQKVEEQLLLARIRRMAK